MLFSADHVMGWNSSVVGPPGGNMRDYFASLRRLLERGERVYLPGHGPVLEDPKPFVRALLVHREMREGAILKALTDEPQGSEALMERLYSKIDPMLKKAAERNVMAHLLKLGEEGKAREAEGGWVK